ncbi:barstar family protein [Pseudonocardia sp. CA-107938]|uniref:barstar family protein n=1 Tax=Pseudonocardia sp. CA-107938 TaxID=3240021 RepID=UPI003D8B1360
MRTSMDASAAAAEARSRGAVVGVVGPAARPGDLLTQIGRELQFPDYYGHNLDALEECLADLSWLPDGEVVLVWDGADDLRRADPTGHAALLEVLTAAVEERAGTHRPLQVVLPSPPANATRTTLP